MRARDLTKLAKARELIEEHRASLDGAKQVVVAGYRKQAYLVDKCLGAALAGLDEAILAELGQELIRKETA